MASTEIPPILADRREALAAAERVAASVSRRVDQAEAGRSVPAETIRELLDAGLMGVVTPRAWGGSELGVSTLYEVQKVLARACASTGWVYGVLAGHTWLAALFPRKAQEEVFSDPEVLIASLVRLGGNAPAKVDGGFRWTGGTGRFCSGIDHSSWVLAGGQATYDDGDSERLYFLIPRSEIRVIDDWQTVGLKGTGSKSIEVTDAFIPEHRIVRFSSLIEGIAPGSAIHTDPIYALPYDSVWPLSLPGAVIGGAQAAVDEFTRTLAAKVGGMESIAQAAQGSSYERLARAAAQVASADALLQLDARSVDSAVSGTIFDELEKTRRQRNLAFAVQQARDAVNALYEASGGSGVYLTAPMQRWWRDVNVAAQHVMFTWDIASVSYGRSAVGIGNQGAGGVKIAPGVPVNAR